MSLLDNTLPTIVGMGVVSQTTQTMFGKGRRGKGRSKAPVRHKSPAKKAAASSAGVTAKTFVYRGRRYHIVYTTPSQTYAARAQRRMYPKGGSAIKKISERTWAIGIRR